MFEKINEFISTGGGIDILYLLFSRCLASTGNDSETLSRFLCFIALLIGIINGSWSALAGKHSCTFGWFSAWFAVIVLYLHPDCFSSSCTRGSYCSNCGALIGEQIATGTILPHGLACTLCNGLSGWVRHFTSVYWHAGSFN